MIWEIQKTNHEKRKQELTAQGLTMAKAGPPPLLRDVALGEEPCESAGPSSNAEITQKQQKGKGRQPHISIDLLISKAINYNDTESSEESECWSVHDESDG